MLPLRSIGYIDPGWEHGVAQDDRKKKVKCNYCGKVVSGGIYRLKQHLARVSGEVTYCDRAPDEVYLKMRENLEACRSSKKPRLSEDSEKLYLNFHSHQVNNDQDIRTAGFKRKAKRVLGAKTSVPNFSPLHSLGYVDPGWEYGVAQDERKKKVKCNFCGKIVSGGINRFKQHLARIPGEVAPCKIAPELVYLKMKENMKWHRSGSKPRRPDVLENPHFYVNCGNEADVDELGEDAVHLAAQEKLMVEGKGLANDIIKASSERISSEAGCGFYSKKSRSNSDLVKSSPRRQCGMAPSTESRKEVIAAICEFFYYAGVPPHAANSIYFQKMLELVGRYGAGLVGPSSRLIAGQCLQEQVRSIKNRLLDYRASWVFTGCSIMVDSWKGKQGRTRINFLVSCPQGVHFISSVDAENAVDDASNLFMLMDKVVDEIGEENVVQVVTQNTPSYRNAGKMLEDKRKNLFWTPCATYCIDQMLEDFMKFNVVAECMEKAQRITKFIYNRTWLLNLMKKEFTGGQDILRPAITRPSASFATTQCLMDQRVGLRRMFLSNKWLSSHFSNSSEGKEVEKIVLDGTFWKKMQCIQKSVEPILTVLKKAESIGNPSMSCIYDDMHKAKLAIEKIHGDDIRKYGPFLSVIEGYWGSVFHHPLCLAAAFLNPAYCYHSGNLKNPEMMRGLNECIVRLEPDGGRRISASMQISDFISAKDDFGTELAISTRTLLDPAAWWQQHGINCLELQRIAVRTLSQTCSSFGCEHNWISYSRSSNRPAQRKLNGLAYAHYNLRLSEREKWSFNSPMSLDPVLVDGLLDDWISETVKQPMQDDEDLLGSEDSYDYDMTEYDHSPAGPPKGSLEMVTLANIEPLALDDPSIAGPANDDSPELDFIDNDTSD